jgi:NADPH:quinone reductase-like Zn-dependent oxidoreductase
MRRRRLVPLTSDPIRAISGAGGWLCRRTTSSQPSKLQIMRKYALGDEPGFENLRTQSADEPAVNRHSVLVDMRAWSLNYRDLLVATGKYGGKYQPGLVPLSDGAGEVIAVGDEVTEFKPGDMVASCFFKGWAEGPLSPAKAKTALGGAVDGVLAERVAMPEWSWVKAPSNLSFDEAATLPCAALTAWNALFDTADLKPGQTVLLQGTGGVSMFGLQFAKAAGARVLITSSSDDKLGFADEKGADEGINYKTHPDWERIAFERTGGVGVDVILDVGGSDTLGKSLRAARYGGRIVVIGVLSGGVAELPIGHLLTKNLQLTGIYVGSREQFIAMNRAIEQAGISPVIDRRFEFGDAVSAYRRIQSGEHMGKIVIVR